MSTPRQPRCADAAVPAALAAAAVRAPYSQGRGFAAGSVTERRDAQKPLNEVLADAGKKALGGGVAGAAAMTANVALLMWLRTVVQFQYRYGMGTAQALRHLYNDGGRGLGGVLRFYRGVGAALLQAPLARFGDTAANAGALALLEGLEATRELPVWLKTGCASVAAASFRIALMPLDTFKTVLQVEGAKGSALLRQKLAVGGPKVLFSGSIGAASATLAGHYPWFLVYNELNAHLPSYDRRDAPLAFFSRAAGIGFAASACSDTISNSLRVLKTTKQASAALISYPQAVRQVVEADGVRGLFLRGLQTKILANGLQGMLFSVLWRLGQDYINERDTGKQG